jgi:hypothetical protein
MLEDVGTVAELPPGEVMALRNLVNISSSESTEGGVKEGPPTSPREELPLPTIEGWKQVMNINLIYDPRHFGTFEIPLPQARSDQFLVPYLWSGMTTTPYDSVFSVEKVNSLGLVAFFKRLFTFFKRVMELVIGTIELWKKFASEVLHTGEAKSMVKANQDKEHLRKVKKEIYDKEPAQNPRTPMESLPRAMAEFSKLGQLRPDQTGIGILAETAQGRVFQLFDKQGALADVLNWIIHSKKGWRLPPGTNKLRFQWITNHPLEDLPNERRAYKTNDGDCYGSFMLLHKV